MEEFKPYLGQIMLQITYGGMTVIVNLALKDGLNNFVLVAYRLAIATLAITPIAYVLERKERPPLTCCILFQIFLISFGISISQNCYFEGIYYTSPTFASAVINLVPIITFLMAILVRVEKFDIRTLRGQAMVVGTVLCVGGAMLMTFYRGPAIWTSRSSSSVGKETNKPNSSGPASTNKALGSLLVFGSVLAWSAWLTFQGPVMKRYPPPLSFTSLMCLCGSLQSGLIGIIVEHNQWDIWVVRGRIQLLTVLYAGIICSALAFLVQAYCIRKKGPVFAAVFNPLCTVTAALLECIFFHVSLHVGSVVGGILIIIGLYIALWGKEKDHAKTNEISTTDGKEVVIDNNQHSIEEDHNH